MLDFINGLVYWEPSRKAVRNGEEELTWFKSTKQMISLIASKSEEEEEEEVVLAETIERNDEFNREWTKAFQDVLTT